MILQRFTPLIWLTIHEKPEIGQFLRKIMAIWKVAQTTNMTLKVGFGSLLAARENHEFITIRFPLDSDLRGLHAIGAQRRAGKSPMQNTSKPGEDLGGLT
jgi:hypothetical protein